jgi:hypothetical protein
LPRSSPGGVGVGVGVGCLACATGASTNQESVNVMRSGRIAALSCISGFIPSTKEKNGERFRKNENSFTVETADCPDVGQNLASLSRQFTRQHESPLQVQECSQLFVRVHNETLAAIAAILVSIVRSIGGYKPPFPIPQKQSAFHPHAQRLRRKSNRC